MSDELDLESQPNGIHLENTISVVSNILTDQNFANEVAEHNSWREDLTSEQIALLFMVSRYQWSVDLLSRQTKTLRNELSELHQRLIQLEDCGS